ncbi:hypothetical protein DPMN_003919 [Dreissena polymorpha]|uniref:Uncharacterized protein n=1 Tax=Dreissena polymorpha TaxID=45954 RepID=A0A9D4RVE5_DREPO|nr:hypothetical protein DPMN_003919 [Dreissena polymorpha]
MQGTVSHVSRAARHLTFAAPPSHIALTHPASAFAMTITLHVASLCCVAAITDTDSAVHWTLNTMYCIADFLTSSSHPACHAVHTPWCGGAGITRALGVAIWATWAVRHITSIQERVQVATGICLPSPSIVA